MKMSLMLITLFVSCAATASGIRFSNNLVLEYDGSFLSHDPHAGSGSARYLDSLVTYEGVQYITTVYEEWSPFFAVPFDGEENERPFKVDGIVSFDFENENNRWQFRGERTGDFFSGGNSMVYEFKTFDLFGSEPTLISTENITLFSDIDVPITETPVPGAIWLFGTGMIGLFRLTKRQEKSNLERNILV